MLKYIAKGNPEKVLHFQQWAHGLGGGASAVAIFLMPMAVPSAFGQAPNIPGVSLSQLEQALRPNNTDKIATANIRLDGRTLFAIAAPALAEGANTNDGITPIVQRQQTIEQAIARFVTSDLKAETLTIRVAVDPNSGLPVVTINNQYLMTVTTLDAQLQGTTPMRWAEELARILKSALLQASQERQPQFLIRQGMIGGGILLGMAIATGIISRGYRRLRQQDAEIENKVSDHVATDTLASPATDNLLTVSQLQHQRHKSFIDVKRRILQIVQVGIWGGGTFSLLGLFPYTRWLRPILFSAPLKILGIGLGVYVLVRLSDMLVDRFFAVVEEGQYLPLNDSHRLALRVSTVTRVSKSVVTILIIGTGTLASLAVLGVDLIPLLAGAGIIGLGISFASQNVIKDIINGFLILLEDQYAVGDVVVIGDVGGLVENMNLRITQLRNNEGRLITVPNSAITIVQNLSKDWSRVDLNLSVAFDTDPDRVLIVLKQLSEEIYRDRQWHAKILEMPEVLGIDAMDHTGLLIRIWIKTSPLEQWAVAREFRRRLKQVMEVNHIEIGMPQQFLRFNRSFGSAPGNLESEEEPMKL